MTSFLFKLNLRILNTCYIIRYVLAPFVSSIFAESFCTSATSVTFATAQLQNPIDCSETAPKLLRNCSEISTSKGSVS